MGEGASEGTGEWLGDCGSPSQVTSSGDCVKVLVESSYTQIGGKLTPEET